MEPMIEIAGARVFLGDCRDVLKTLPDNSVDSIVTDPPYGLEFMGKDWDAPWKASGTVETVFEGADKSHPFRDGTSRVRYGNKDMTGFQLWCTEWAVECLRVLKPGGHILAFGGSRTWHRLAVAVEDAGFELRDSIAWIYGSGFPKSLDVSKAIDKRAGVEREILHSYNRKGRQSGILGKEVEITRDITAPSSSEAKAWQGWGTALKPAFEPVVVGRKPLVGTVAENVLAWGVGGLNIDGSRIGFRNQDDKNTVQSAQWHAVPNDTYGKFQRQHDREIMNGADSTPDKGRWPANVILDEVSAGLLDEQSGVSVSKLARRGLQTSGQAGGLAGENPNYNPDTNTVRGHEDSGGASRFFYVAKASKRDRNEGLEELEGASSGAKGNGLARVCESCGASILKPCDCSERSFVNPPVKNFHPTVKPTQLMRYLIKLVTPEGGVVLDPFTGSGSTGKAALLDGYQFIGAELTEEYLPIIEGRLRWASEQEGEDNDTLF